MNDSWFLAVGLVVLVGLLGVAAVAATGPETDSAAELRPDVPDVHDVEPPTEPGTATIDGTTYESIDAALDAAEPDDTVVLEGVFEEHVTVETPNVTLRATEPNAALVDGGGDGTVLEVHAENVTLDGLWVRASGTDRADEPAGVFVNGSDATLTYLRLTDITFGVWISNASGVTVADATIVGDETVGQPERGNGIHLDRATGAELRNNHITTVRDGIYYSWSDGVVSENNVMWDLRYGVHYMYSEDNVLEGNAAFDNDVGFALMVSANLTIANNTAVANDGPSGQGILVRGVDDSLIAGNVVAHNRNGLFVYNSYGNTIVENHVEGNQVGVHVTAGSTGELVAGNAFIHNGESAYATSNAQVTWNTSTYGNYWSDARAVDLDGDGTSEIRHRPAGAVERLVHERPQAGVFAESPAFDAVRLAESSFPVVETRGVVDHHPLAEPPVRVEGEDTEERLEEDWEDHDADGTPGNDAGPPGPADDPPGEHGDDPHDEPDADREEQTTDHDSPAR